MNTPRPSRGRPTRRTGRSSIATRPRWRWPRPASRSGVASPTKNAWPGPGASSRRWATGCRRPGPRSTPSRRSTCTSEPERELKLQAIRVGALGIAAIPDEVYALTGLKIKARSPLAPTFVIELANGSEGYIPPPEQHALGGYTTWPARTAALEVQAEPRIVDAVARPAREGRRAAPTRRVASRRASYAEAVLASKPLAYWRLGEMAGPEARDATGHGRAATYEGGVALYLDGPPLPGPSSDAPPANHAAHLAGGHLVRPCPGSAPTTASSSGSGTACPPRPA